MERVGILRNNDCCLQSMQLLKYCLGCDNSHSEIDSWVERKWNLDQSQARTQFRVKYVCNIDTAYSAALIHVVRGQEPVHFRRCQVKVAIVRLLRIEFEHKSAHNNSFPSPPTQHGFIHILSDKRCEKVFVSQSSYLHRWWIKVIKTDTNITRREKWVGWLDGWQKENVAAHNLSCGVKSKTCLSE